MERLIRTAWRAFWVGLGASAVLIAQSLLSPASPNAMPASIQQQPQDPNTAPAFVQPSIKAKNADPILSRNPFDSTHGKKRVYGGQS